MTEAGEHRKGPAVVLTPQRRRRLYSTATAAMPLLTAYGVVEDNKAALWLSLVAAVLGVQVARRHVPKTPERPPEP